MICGDASHNHLPSFPAAISEGQGITNLSSSYMEKSMVFTPESKDTFPVPPFPIFCIPSNCPSRLF